MKIWGLCALDSTGNAVRKIIALSFASCYLHFQTALLMLLIPNNNSGPSCCTYMYTGNFKRKMYVPSRIVVKFYTKFCSILIAMGLSINLSQVSVVDAKTVAKLCLKMSEVDMNTTANS